MDLLEKLVVRVVDASGAEEQVPLSNVLASHEMMRAGCPVDQVEECPPLWWAQLASEQELRALADLVRRIELQVESAGGTITFT